jgi:hypothetical protein
MGSAMDGTSGFILFELGGKMGSFGKLFKFPFLGSSSFVFGASGSRSAGLLLATRRDFGQPMTDDSIVAREGKLLGVKSFRISVN